MFAWRTIDSIFPLQFAGGLYCSWRWVFIDRSISCVNWVDERGWV